MRNLDLTAFKFDGAFEIRLLDAPAAWRPQRWPPSESSDAIHRQPTLRPCPICLESRERFRRWLERTQLCFRYQDNRAPLFEHRLGLR